MFLFFKNCAQCYGPTKWKRSYLDQRFFKNTTETAVTSDLAGITGLSFSHIDREQAQRIQNIERDLRFILEGVVGGLSNGRIALHGAGNLIRKCGHASKNPKKSYPISLTVTTSSDKKQIAKFDMHWEQ